MIKVCPVCKNGPANFDPTLGTLPCTACQERGKTNLSHPVEFTSESIKEDRKRFQKDILQPFRAGELSAEYIKAYGTKGINVTKEEVKKAIPTTDSYYG